MRDPQRSYYRKNIGRTPITFRPPGATSSFTVAPGEWIRADLTVGAARANLRLLDMPTKVAHVDADLREAARAEQEILGSTPTAEVGSDRAGLLVIAPAGVDVHPHVPHDRVAFVERAQMREALRAGIESHPVVAVTVKSRGPAWFEQAVRPLEDGPIESGLYTHPFNIARRVAVVVALTGDSGRARRVVASIWDAGSVDHESLVLAGPAAVGFPDSRAAAYVVHDGPVEATISAGIARAFEFDVDAVAVVVDDAEVFTGWLDGLDRARRRTGADVVVPLCNRAGPLSLPLAGESAPWSTRRLPHGHAADIASAMRLSPPKYPAAAPPHGGCYMISREAWARIQRIPSDGIAGVWDRAWLRAVIADDVFVWREFDTYTTPGPRSQYEATTGLRQTWSARAVRYHSIAAARRPAGLPVQLLAVDLGKWGGSYCTLRLACELRRWGIAAQVGRLRESSGVERFPLGTVHHQREQDLPEAFSAASGWANGVCVATHWSTGRLVRRICASNPGIVPAAFWQDREDLFTDPKNPARRFPKDQARDYISIPHRVVNAVWQIESVEGDFGRQPGSFTHIPVGVDCATFRPRRERKPGPIRVVAMYRPQTPRRGAARLLEAFSRLHRWRGGPGGLSLEVFGWSDGLPPWIRSHGFLSQSDVASLLREADIVVEPSDFQGFGLVGAEAMASGAALVSTDTQGVWAYASQTSARIVGAPGACSAEELADAVAELVDDAAARDELAREGRRAAMRIDWSVIGARWAVWLADLWREHGTDSALQEAADLAAERARDHLRAWDTQIILHSGA